MSDTPKHSVSVAGIVTDSDGRILVIRRRDNDHWEPPGGVLELGETFEQGVRREVYEETGVVVAVTHLSGVYKNIERDIVALVFRCAAETTDVSASAEAAEVRWMSRDEVREKMDPAYAVRVLDAFSAHPHFRTHDGVQILSED